MYTHLNYLTVAATNPLRFFFFNDTATTEIYTLSLHDALPIYRPISVPRIAGNPGPSNRALRRTRWQVRPAQHRSPTVRVLAPASPAPQRSARRTRRAQRPLPAAALAIATQCRRRARRTAAHERRGT